MPNLKDVLDGKITIGKSASISYKGKVYRGRAAIMELAKAQVGSNNEVENGTDSEPAAEPEKPKRKRASRAKKPVEQPAELEQDSGDDQQPADES